MEYLLFVAYLVLFAWLTTKVKFFRSAGLSNAQLVMLFLLKVLAGIFYGWIGTYYANLARMSDTWAFHELGVAEYHLMISDPKEYLTNLFHNSYPDGMERFFASRDSYWNDLKGNIFVKLLSFFNIFSQGSYYVNVILYAFISLFGPVALFRVFADIFPKRRNLVLLAVFLLPSFMFWTSGLHKEGLISTAISIIVYHLYFGLKAGKMSAGRWVAVILSMGVLLVLRNFLVMLVIPAVVSWLITMRWPRRGLPVFVSVYAFSCLFFFTAKHIHPGLDFPAAVVDKQKAFLRLQGGGSTIPVKKLEPTAESFMANTPQAVSHSILRPYPSDVRDLLTLAASAEVLLILLVFVVFLLFRRRNGEISRNTVLLCLFLSFSILLAIGFSINNLGAIERYRSVVLPLLVVPMLASTDWKKIGAIFTNNKRRTTTRHDEFS